MKLLNIFDIAIRASLGLAIGLFWMAGSMMLITWNRLHGKETYLHEIT